MRNNKARNAMARHIKASRRMWRRLPVQLDMMLPVVKREVIMARNEVIRRRAVCHVAVHGRIG